MSKEESKDLFNEILKKKYSDLLELAKTNNYKLLVPLKKFITESMLDRNFYEHHIFFNSKFDENMFINLNGKVLKLEGKEFKSYLGWKQEMKLNIKDDYKYDNLYCLVVDNVCQENVYEKPKEEEKDDKKDDKKLKRFLNLKGYLDYYGPKNFPTELDKAFNTLDKETSLLRNNYILLKGFEESYAKDHFMESALALVDDFRKGLKAPDTPNTNLIIAELVDSLIFSRMYAFLINSLTEFNKDDQQEMNNRIKENPTLYSLETMNINKAFKHCKFERAIEVLKEIENKLTIFEKSVS